MIPFKSSVSRLGVVILALGLWGVLPATGSGQESPLQRVAAMVERGELVEAEALLDGVLAADPSDFDARIQRGNIRSLRGNYAGAREDFGSALATRPGSYEAYLGTGWAFAWEGMSR
jgi:tetratricopeptide (TPR) repeat protein